MNFVSLSNVFILPILGLLGISGGAAITTKLLNGEAGMEVFRIGCVWLIAGFIGLVLLYHYARRRAIAHLLFVALGVNVSGASMTVGISLPLFWLHGLVSSIGLTLLGYFAAMLFYQLWRAHSHFVACWEKNHEKALAKVYKPIPGVMQAEELMRRLQVRADLFLPARLEHWNGVVSGGLILAMIIGLNLRKIFPQFSAFAWGIPALTLTTILFQMAFLRILLALRVRDLEKIAGAYIGPMDDNEVEAIKRRKRKSKTE